VSFVRGPLGLLKRRGVDADTSVVMRVVRVTAVFVGLLGLLGGLLSSAHGVASAATTNSARLGVYSGAATTSSTDGFSGWLGSQVVYASDYVDNRYTWNDVSTPSWLINAWAPWVAAAPNRRLVIGVPLLIDSAKGQMAAGAAGSFDGYFRTLAQNLVNRGLGSSVIRLGFEANCTWMSWFAGNDPTSYKKYYGRLVTLMRKVPGARFSFDWNPLAGTEGGSSLTTFDSFYPGDAYVDVIGLDNYDLKWEDSTSTPAQRWSWLLTRPMGLNDFKAVATRHHKPMSVPEWGMWASGTQMGGGGDSPYYVDAMADWFAANNVLYQSYFNSNDGGGTLDAFPNGQAEYKARFGTP
jgi:hypothetical protein